jgi:hypothetical protein
VTVARRHYLVASDFDKTLTLDDSGAILSDLMGVAGFQQKVQALAATNLVQQGGELAYLLLNDPEFRPVRRHHLTEVGRKVRLKHNVRLLAPLLSAAAEGHSVSFHVLSAAARRWRGSSRQIRSTGPASATATTAPSPPSSTSRPATERWRCSMPSRRSWRSATIASSTWATAARTST